MTGWVLSIDLGTTNTVAAVRIGSAAPERLELSTSGHELVSSVFLSASSVYVGEAAVAHAAEDLASFYPSPKRLLMQTTVDQLDTLRPVFSALYREVYRRAVGRYGPTLPESVIVTHPEALSDRARALLVAAAEEAGIDRSVIRTVPEPVAAAAYACRDVTVPDRLLVIDVGGGTCDTAVVRFDTAGTPVVMAARGDNGLGGRTFDHRMTWAVAGLIDGGTPDTETVTALGGQAGHRIIEQSRKALSLAASCSLDLSEPLGEANLPGVTFRRTDLESAIYDDVEKIRTVSLATLSDAGVKPGEAQVFLTGGTGLTPAVQQAVVGTGTVRPVSEPFSAVSLGALLTTDVQPRATTTLHANPGVDGRTDDHGGHRGWRTAIIVACVAAVAVVGGVALALRPDTGGNDSVERQETAGTRTEFDPSPVIPVTLPEDSVLLDSGYLDCSRLMPAASEALRADTGDVQMSTPTGFNGITRCVLSGDDHLGSSKPGEGNVVLETLRPSGFTFFNTTQNKDSAWTTTSAAEDLPGWYRIVADGSPGPSDRVFLYVRDAGWFVISVTGEAASGSDLALNLARAVSPLIREEVQ